jgi:uroporphyrinogen decarboxylase
MTDRENYLRAVRFERPDWIPMIFHINPACWRHYDTAALEDLKAAHPRLFPELQMAHSSKDDPLGPWQQASRPFTDPWGSVWRTCDDGIMGTVVEYPLANWAAFETYHFPDPNQTDGLQLLDWAAVEASLRQGTAAGRLGEGGLPHGHTFLRLIYLRGYENLMFDMADEDPRLLRLIAAVEEFNAAVVERYLQAGAEVVAFPEDLGMQRGPMLSPGHFRRYIQPSYRRLMAPVREAGMVVHAHSDGDIRSLADDMLDCGIDAINLQDLVNGVDWIAAHLKGRVCLDLDIDRQSITRFGPPAEIDRLIREEVATLGSAVGGLMMIYGLYPGVPLKNVGALMEAMQRYATYFA